MLPNGPILFIGQHPDDAHAAAGGLASTASAAGIDVFTACFTRGEAGWRPGQPQHEIDAIRSGRLRTAEQRRADHILGIRHTFFLDGFRDGELSGIDPRYGADTLIPVLQDVKPATVISWDHTGFFGHPDHRWGALVSGLAMARAGLTGAQLWFVAFTPRARRLIPARAFVNGHRPRAHTGELILSYPLPGDIHRQKQRALAQHHSQSSLADLHDWGAIEEFYAAT